MNVSNNANVIIEMYHILHSVQSSVQSSIDDVISYCKMRRAKFLKTLNQTILIFQTQSRKNNS